MRLFLFFCTTKEEKGKLRHRREQMFYADVLGIELCLEMINGF